MIDMSFASINVNTYFRLEPRDTIINRKISLDGESLYVSNFGIGYRISDDKTVYPCKCDGTQISEHNVSS